MTYLLQPRIGLGNRNQDLRRQMSCGNVLIVPTAIGVLRFFLLESISANFFCINQSFIFRFIFVSFSKLILVPCALGDFNQI